MEARSVKLSLYTDGGLLSSNPSSKGGTYAFVILDDNEDVVIQKSGVIDIVLGVNGHVTNNIAELYALAYGIVSIPSGASVDIFCDSENALNRLFQYGTMANVPEWLVLLTKRAKHHLRELDSFTYAALAGHPSKEELRLGKSIHRESNGKIMRYGGIPVSKWNQLCDKMCNEARARYEAEKELAK